MSDPQETPAERLRVAFELFDLGVGIMRARLRRQHPDESGSQIEARLEDWLMERPGAEHGDSAGVLREWSSRS